jgi:hypothetical protein
MGKDDVLQTTGSALQFLSNRTRLHDAQGSVTVLQPTPVQDAVTRRVEGFLNTSEPGIRRHARSLLCRQPTLFKIPPELAEHRGGQRAGQLRPERLVKRRAKRADALVEQEPSIPAPLGAGHRDAAGTPARRR